MLKIKLVNADKELVGKTLFLEKTEEILFTCSITGIKIIDTWDELMLLQKCYTESGCKDFYDLHLFSDSFGDLQFIYEVKFLPSG